MRERKQQPDGTYWWDNRKININNYYPGPGTVLFVLCGLYCLTLKTTLGSRCYHSEFTDEEIESQRD